jgi:uncharacterized protein (DUF1684 family)
LHVLINLMEDGGRDKNGRYLLLKARDEDRTVRVDFMCAYAQ